MGEEKPDPLKHIKKKIDKTIESIGEKPVEKEKPIGITTEPTVEDLHAYRMLADKLKIVISKVYNKLKERANASFGEIKIEKRYTLENFVSNIIPSDEKVYGKHLQLYSHELTVGQEQILMKYNTDVYTTDKRLVLVNYKKDKTPHLRTRPDILVSHVSRDRCYTVPIPLKHITNVRLSLDNKASASAHIYPVAYILLLILGIIGVIVGLLMWIGTTNAAYFFLILLGITLIVLYYILKSYKADDPGLEVERSGIIYLSILDPFYLRRAVLMLRVNTEVHELEDIICWVREIEERCKNIV